MSLKVFVSYAREDREHALKYYELLRQEGVSPWMDIKCIFPGQNWEAELEKAFTDANVVVLLISKQSIGKRGFVQREANEAIERLRYKQPTDIYIIPLLLEPCDVPDHIARRLQYEDLGVPGAWERVRHSLELAAAQQSLELARGLIAGPFRVFAEELSEQWEGTPGHDIKIKYSRFESASRPDLAKELTSFFLGRAMGSLVGSRRKPWQQLPDFFRAQDKSLAFDGRWEDFGIVYVNDKLLSLAYEISCYTAGATHPNSRTETFNFSLIDRLCVLELSDFFIEDIVPLDRLMKICVSSLVREYWVRVGEEPDVEQLEWFKTGVTAELRNFTAFSVASDHLTFHFAPGAVSGYALGRWSVEIPFYDLREVLVAHGPHRLVLD